METQLNRAHSRYATIQIVRSDSTTERFVLAYDSEKSLRELLAGPSIVASGFAARQQAEERCFENETSFQWFLLASRLCLNPLIALCSGNFKKQCELIARRTHEVTEKFVCRIALRRSSGRCLGSGADRKGLDRTLSSGHAPTAAVCHSA